MQRNLMPPLRQARAARIKVAAPPLLKVLGLLAACLTLSACQKKPEPGEPASQTQAPANHAAAPTKDLTPQLPMAAGKYTALPGFQQVFADVAERAIPAVVSVHSEKDAPRDPAMESVPDESPFHWFFGPQGPHGEQGNPRRESGLGSGVLISQDGYVITNNHVVEGATAIRVTLSDEREVTAKLVGADKASDMAVLKLQEGGPFTTMPMGDSEKLRIGEWVLAVGSPYGLSQTVTAGIISAKSRSNTGINSYENFLQTDAAINPGNSGGALMNLSGELIGINTAIFSRSGGYQGIGFAIPINMARKIMEDLIRDGEVTRGWLGVSIQPIDQGLAEALGLKERRGALVGGVVEGSPAEKAGIKRGDALLSLDGKPLRDHSDLLNRIAMIAPGTWVELQLHRNGKSLNIKVRVARRDENRLSNLRETDPDGPAAARLGIEVAPVSQRMRERYALDPMVKRGVVVTAIEPTGRAALGKLKEGDVILEINRRQIQDPRQFDDLLRQALKGNRLLLLIGRGSGSFYTTL